MLHFILLLKSHATHSSGNLGLSVYSPCPHSEHNVQTGGLSEAQPVTQGERLITKGEQTSAESIASKSRNECSSEQEVVLMNSTGFSAWASND